MTTSSARHTARAVRCERENRAADVCVLIRSVSARQAGGLTRADGRACCPHPPGVGRTAATAAAPAQDVGMTPLTPPTRPVGGAASATHGAALTFETLVEGEAAHARLRA